MAAARPRRSIARQAPWFWVGMVRWLRLGFGFEMAARSQQGTEPSQQLMGAQERAAARIGAPLRFWKKKACRWLWLEPGLFFEGVSS